MASQHNGIFSPAALLLQRLPIASKFFLILLVFILPLTYMSWTVVLEKQRQIRFHQMQQAGLQRLAAASELLFQMGSMRDRRYAAALGHTVEVTEPSPARSGVVEGLQRLREAGSTSTRQQLDEVLRLWQAWQGSNDQPLEAHNLGFALNQAMRRYMLQLAEDDRLLLGNDLTTYQLSHIGVDSLAYAVDLVSALRGLGSGIIARGHFTPDSFIKLSYYAGELDDTLDTLKRAYEVAGQGNPRLQAQAFEALTGMRDYLETVRGRVIDPDRFTISAKRYAYLGAQSLRSLKVLHEATEQGLHQRLNERISHQTWLMYEVVGISTAIILLVMYLFSGFYYSMKRGIHEINASLAAIAKGDLNRRAEVSGRDEIRTIADNLNHTAGQLEELVRIAYSKQTLESNREAS